MCVAMPGRVITVNGRMADVDFKGNVVRADAGLVRVKPGDSVLVHAGCILQVLTEFDHRMMMELLDDLEECSCQEDSPPEKETSYRKEKNYD